LSGSAGYPASGSARTSASHSASASASPSASHPLLRPTAENLALWTLGLAGFLLSGALAMEYVLGMVPCPLCLMQRIWFLVAGLFAVAGLLHDPRWGIYPLLTGLAAAVGGGFAIRQLYLMALPADRVPACGPDIDYMIEVFPMSQVLSAMVRGTGDCASLDSFLWIPVPVWALLGFAALILLAVLQIRAGNRT
jgi:protein dithiol:quinone oxidoreductase